MVPSSTNKNAKAVGLFGHILGVSCLEGFVANHAKIRVYSIGVGLFGHILGVSCLGIMEKYVCILSVWVSLDIC